MQGSRLDNKGAQRTGKVAGARPDDARWRSRRRLEQFSVNEYYREEVFRWSRLNESRPSEEYVVTVPVGCLEYSEPAQGELGRRTETRLGLGRRRLAGRPIPIRAMSVGAALGSRRRGRNEGPRTLRYPQRRTSNPSTRFDGSTQTRLHAVAASCGGLTRSSAGRRLNARRGARFGSYLVDPASSHMLVSKIKPCMSKHKLLHSEAANGSLGHP